MKNWSGSHIEVLNGSILLLLGLSIWIYSGTFPDLQEGYPGPALFPRLISLVFLLSSLVLLAIHIPKLLSAANTAVETKEVLEARGYTLLGGIAIIALFPFISEFLGFLITLGISIFGIALLFRINYLNSGLIAIGTLVTIHLTFNVLLGVPLS